MSREKKNVPSRKKNKNKTQCVVPLFLIWKSRTFSCMFFFFLTCLRLTFLQYYSVSRSLIRFGLSASALWHHLFPRLSSNTAGCNVNASKQLLDLITWTKPQNTNQSSAPIVFQLFFHVFSQLLNAFFLLICFWFHLSPSRHKACYTIMVLWLLRIVNIT